MFFLRLFGIPTTTVEQTSSTAELTKYSTIQVLHSNADGSTLHSHGNKLVKKFLPCSQQECQQIQSRLKKFAQIPNMFVAKSSQVAILQDQMYHLIVEYECASIPYHDAALQTFFQVAERKNRNLGADSKLSVLQTMRALVHRVRLMHIMKLTHGAITMDNTFKEKCNLVILGDAVHGKVASKSQDVKQVAEWLKQMSEAYKVSLVSLYTNTNLQA